MTERDCDAVVLGAGPAAIECAVALGRGGLRVALVHREGLDAGARHAPHRLPARLWRAAADRLSGRGDGSAPARLDSAALDAELTRRLAAHAERAERTLAEAGVEMVAGEARFADGHSLDVTAGPTAASSPGRIRFGHAVVAELPAAEPAAGVSGLDGDPGDRVVALEDLAGLPAPGRRLAIAGASATALEIAQVLADTGAAEVLLLRGANDFLSALDPDTAARLGASLESTPNLSLETDAVIERVVAGDEGLRIAWRTAGGAERERDVDKLVLADGRPHDAGRLAPERAGLEIGSGDVALDAQGRTAVEHIHWLAESGPAAAAVHDRRHKGQRVAAAILGRAEPPAPRTTATTIHTRPCLAVVGSDAAAARADGIEPVEADCAEAAATPEADDPQAWVKLTADAGDGLLLGARALGAAAPSWAAWAAGGISAGMMVDALAAAAAPEAAMASVVETLAERLQARWSDRGAVPGGETDDRAPGPEGPFLPTIPGGDAPAAARAVYAEIERHYGFVPRLYKTLAHHPPLLSAVWHKVKMVMGRGPLRDELKEAISVAVSRANGCDYCVRIHTGMLRQLGVSAKSVAPLRRGRLDDLDFLDEREIKLLRLTARVNADATAIDYDEVSEVLAAGVSYAELIHAFGVLDVYLGHNKMLVGLRVEFEKRSAHGHYPGS